jgi:hypothetical protein
MYWLIGVNFLCTCLHQVHKGSVKSKERLGSIHRHHHRHHPMYKFVLEFVWFDVYSLSFAVLLLYC